FEKNRLRYFHWHVAVCYRLNIGMNGINADCHVPCGMPRINGLLVNYQRPIYCQEDALQKA
ncbi:MAG: hypothetical protein WCP46_07025, partial [Alphaproteobacteria bacterium]